MGALLTLGAAQSAFAADSVGTTDGTSTAPAVSVDKTDYQPGDTVTYGGAGFAPGEYVQLSAVGSVNGTLIGAGSTADSSGTFAGTFDLPNMYEEYYALTATGQSSGLVATTTFGDSFTGTLKFCAPPGSACAPITTGTLGNIAQGGSVTVTVITNPATPGLPIRWPVAGVNATKAGGTQGGTITALPPVPNGNFNCAINTTDSNGEAQATFTATSATGPYAIEADVMKNANCGNDQSANAAGTIGFGLPTSVTAVSGNGSVGGNATVTATVTSNGTPLVGATVDFTLTVCQNSSCTNTAQTAATGTTNASGVATASIPLQSTPVGTYTGVVLAAFPGDATHSSSSNTGDLTVTNLATAVSLVSGSGTYGGTGSLTATLKQGSTALNGKSISFTADDGAGHSISATASTNASGVATATGVSMSSLPAGNWTLTASFAGDSTYGSSSNTGTLAVAKRAVTATPDAESIAYGTALNTSGWTYTITSGSVVGTDSLGSPTYGAAGYSSTTSAAGSTTSITLSGLSNANYTITFGTGTLTVTKRLVTATPNAESIAYGTALNTSGWGYTITSGSVVNGDSLGTATYAAPGYSVTTIAGSTPTITMSGLSNSNYTITFGTGTLTVTTRDITVTPNDEGIVYGTPSVSTATWGYSAPGLVNGDSLTGTAVYSLETAYSSTAVAGTTYTIDLTGLSNSNYAITFGTGTLTVGSRALTLTPGDQSITYGTTSVSTSGWGYTITTGSLVNGDSLTGTAAYTLGSTYAATDAAGTTYVIHMSGLSNSNYAITFGTGTLTVTTRAITVTPNDESIVYGTASVSTAGWGYSAPGLVNGDSLGGTADYTLGTAYAATDHAGTTYEIDLSGLSNSNYDISFGMGTLTVTTRAITVTPSDESIVYGTPSVSTAGWGYAAPGLVNNDTLAGTAVYTLATTYAQYASAGTTYTIDMSGLSNSDYDISYGTGTLTVTTRPITVTPSDESITYGSTSVDTSTWGYSAPGLLGTDTLSGTAVYTLETTYADTDPAGTTYTIDLSGLSNPNYAVSFGTGTLTVTTRPITVTPNNESIVYGTPSVSTSGWGYSAPGLVNGDHLSGTAAYTLETAYAATDHAGTTYKIDLSGLSNSNYAITFGTGTLTVTARPITVTPNNETIVYGTPSVNTSSWGYAAPGLVNSDTLAGTAVYTLETTYAQTAAAGTTYTIDLSGLSNSDYTITFGTGTLTVTARPITVSPNNESIVYGTSSVSTSGWGYAAPGLVNGDSLTGTAAYTLETAYAPTDHVGTSYKIDLSGLSNANYTITFGTGTLTVTARPITVTPDNESIVYGTSSVDMSHWTYQVTTGSLVNGDHLGGTAAYSLASAYSSAAHAGTTYVIHLTGLTESDYSISYGTGTLTVTTRPVTATPDAETIGYGSTLSTSGWTYTLTAGSLVNGDSLGTASYAAAGYTTSSVPGSTFTITMSGLANSDYLISYGTGTLTVGKAPTSTTLGTSATSVQYSDPVTLTATVSPASAGTQTLGGSVQFTLGGSNFGSPVAINSSGIAALTQAVTHAPATNLAVGATFTPTTASGVYFLGSSAPTGTTLTVTQEDARDAYTGPEMSFTTSTSNLAYSVNLSFNIYDITNSLYASDPAHDVYPGNIGNAKVSYFYGAGLNLPTSAIAGCQNLAVSPTASDTTAGTVSCNFTGNLPPSSSGPSSQQYTIGIQVGGYYIRNSSTDDYVISISQPGGTGFITGGGWVIAGGSAGGQQCSGLNNRMNFGYNVHNNKSQSNLQGQANIIFRTNVDCVTGAPGAHVYQIKSNSITSLLETVQANPSTTSPSTETFQAKATLQDITNPNAPVSVDGGALLQLSTTDAGEPGTNDQIAVTLWQSSNKGGGVWFSSDWAQSQSGNSWSTQLMYLGQGHGNLTIH